MPRTLPKFLAAGEVDALLKTAAAQLARARTPAKRRAAALDMAAIQAGLGLGLRVSEFVKLLIEEVDLQNRSLLVSQGKGKKDRYLPIPARLCPLLAAWAGDRHTGPLFASPRGSRLSPRTLQLRLKCLGKKANIPRPLKPHTLRHTYATRLLDAGATIREVQELLGHASIQTTEVYTHCTSERLRNAVDRL